VAVRPCARLRVQSRLHMRILTRYVLREVLGSALIGVAVFSFVLFTRDLGRILELVVRNSAPLPSVAEIFLFTLPVALTYTIPMGVLVGILIGLSRLAADSEITAMRASGIGVWRFARMLSLFVAVAWGLALLNSLWIAPASQAALARLQDRLKTSQASFEVQPRVFYEGFPKAVLYVQDVVSAQRAAVWKGVFLADLSNPTAPRITLARQGLLTSEGPTSLHLHLTGGSTHEMNPASAEDYQISTFDDTDIPIELPAAESDTPKGQPPLGTIETKTLWQQSQSVAGLSASLNPRSAGLEFHRRLALPTACLVLALVGIPLGLSAKKGGKSSGFVLTIILVFAYYSISLIGVSLGKEGKLPVALGAWLADIVFLAAGVFLLYRVERRPIDLGALRRLWIQLKERLRAPARPRSREAAYDAYSRVERRPRVFGLNFPMLLDDYVLKDFFQYLGLIVASFVVLVLVFTLFELLGDILRNHVSPFVVGAYLLNVTPYFLYNTLHLCVLLAVLVTFGILQRNNEVVAMKATGISIYRIIVPVMVVAALLTVGLFVFDQVYLPHANKRQDALRNEIKGKPAQTYLRPDRKWIFGKNSEIYYYQFFDSDRDRFANISVFQFDPETFEVTHRIYAVRAHWEPDLNRWIFEQGWERSLRGPAIENFQEFEVATFPQLSEPPAYFKKELIQSSDEMSYSELQHYIQDLQQSGFDVVRLRVRLHKKLAFPLITLVMALLAVPFSLSAGRRSTLTGAATAVGIAVVYLGVAALFEDLGYVSQLPAALAAWSPDIIFALVGGYLMLKVPT
jgi:LPS export ABC transporter permease LptF/LPS export ABC transporter permease LptG